MALDYMSESNITYIIEYQSNPPLTGFNRYPGKSLPLIKAATLEATLRAAFLLVHI